MVEKERSRRLGTSILNQVVQEAVAFKPPPRTRGGKRGRVYYSTQVNFLHCFYHIAYFQKVHWHMLTCLVSVDCAVCILFKFVCIRVHIHGKVALAIYISNCLHICKYFCFFFCEIK